MANVFTLDALRQEADKDYEALQIDLPDCSVTLRNLIRLSKGERVKVMELVGSFENAKDASEEDDSDHMSDVAEDILRLVADDGAKLIKAINGDLGLTMTILKKWMGSTSLGEPAPSAT